VFLFPGPAHAHAASLIGRRHPSQVRWEAKRVRRTFLGQRRNKVDHGCLPIRVTRKVLISETRTVVGYCTVAESRGSDRCKGKEGKGEKKENQRLFHRPARFAACCVTKPYSSLQIGH
jgi:hypothetical protein